MNGIVGAIIVVILLVCPSWADPEIHEGAAECGACGAELTEYREILSYDGTEWVPCCDFCWALFATESPEHRAMNEQLAAERVAEKRLIAGV